MDPFKVPTLHAEGFLHEFPPPLSGLKNREGCRSNYLTLPFFIFEQRDWLKDEKFKLEKSVKKEKGVVFVLLQSSNNSKNWIRQKNGPVSVGFGSQAGHKNARVQILPHLEHPCGRRASNFKCGAVTW
jgi:hypothetical protein